MFCAGRSSLANIKQDMVKRTQADLQKIRETLMRRLLFRSQARRHEYIKRDKLPLSALWSRLDFHMGDTVCIK